MGKYHRTIPDDDIARKVVDAVCEVYDIEPECVKLGCDFTDYLNSSSLDWSQLLEKLGESFEIEFDDHELDINRYPTVRAVAAYIRDLCSKSGDGGV